MLGFDKTLEDRIEEGYRFLRKREFDKAYCVFKEVADKNYPLGWAMLAHAYHWGEGVAKDISEVKRLCHLIETAANEGNVIAQFSLGFMYETGLYEQFKGIIGSGRSQAIVWERKAADLGYAPAQHIVGWRYKRGDVVAQSDSEAAAWYHKAAVQGNANAQFALGEMYERGDGVAQSDNEAAAWYHKAAEQEHEDAYKNLIKLGLGKEGAPHKSGVPKGNMIAQFALGEMYECGRGVRQSDGEAGEWYRDAAAHGHAVAQFKVGLTYAIDERGYSKAIVWFRKAIANGEPAAECHLGLMYEYGLGLEKNFNVALACYHQAANADYPLAHIILSVIYSQGVVVSKDDMLAKTWLTRARTPPPQYQHCSYDTVTPFFDSLSRQGEVHARFVLAIIYQEGLLNRGKIAISRTTSNDMRKELNIDPGGRLSIISWNDLKRTKEIGVGSYATVYKGRWNLSSKKIAIKQLNNHGFSSDADFENEAKIMSNLSHPHIVHVYGVVLEPHRCIVMEYCRKSTLFSFLQESNNQDEILRYKISLGIALGLEYLHTRRKAILHRDLKSLNILLDESLTPKLADFGIAKRISLSSSGSSENASNKGTKAWMAPEIRSQFSAPSYTKASDVYSCGVVFWEVLTNKRPYRNLERMKTPSSLTPEENFEIYLDVPMSASDMINLIPNGLASTILVDLVKDCLKEKPSTRPRIGDVCKRLTFFFDAPESSTTLIHEPRVEDVKGKGKASDPPSFSSGIL